MSESDGPCFGFFTSREEVKEFLERRLRDGWCVFQGKANVIQALEEVIYTPGTKENKNFEIVGFNPSIIIGKKTAKLNQLIGHPPEFKDIVLVSFEKRLPNNILLARIIWSIDTKATTHLANDLARQLFPDFEGAHKSEVCV